MDCGRKLFHLGEIYNTSKNKNYLSTSLKLGTKIPIQQNSPGRLLYDLEQSATEMKSSDHVYSFNSEEHTKIPRKFLKWNTPFIAILDWGVPNGTLQGPKCNSAE